MFDKRTYMREYMRGYYRRKIKEAQPLPPHSFVKLWHCRVCWNTYYRFIRSYKPEVKD